MRNRGSTGPPPHARGRLAELGDQPRGLGTTPARAGKTSDDLFRRDRGSDHPRTRGEDYQQFQRKARTNGPPPHARGRRGVATSLVSRERTTPARAGKTWAIGRWWSTPRDHPRTRGEDDLLIDQEKSFDGPPPHARGRPCAGSSASIPRRDHPRTRGEDPLTLRDLMQPTGPPPHARGRRKIDLYELVDSGTTPARAGKTSPRPRFPTPPRDHPRTRGEDVRAVDFTP